MKDIEKYLYNRDLSWIEFNDRVIYESKSGRNPLLERAMFLAIASVNLDQFFMVRIPKKRNEKDRKKIYEYTQKMIKKMYDEYKNCINDLEKKIDVKIYEKYNDLDKDEKNEIDNYYKRLVKPILEIMELDPFHPIPRIASGNLVLISEIEPKDKKDKNKTVIVELRGQFDRLIKVNKEKEHFLLIEKLIEEKLASELNDFDIKEIAYFRLTRDEGASIIENYKVNTDIEKEVLDQLEARSWGEVIRVEYNHKISDKLKEYILKNFSIPTAEVYEIFGPINLDFLWTIEGITKYPEEKYRPLEERFFKKMKGTEIFETLKKGDKILLHPFESFEAVTELIDTAAGDPNVIAIKQTLYRVKHHESPIIDALKKACENGKQVTVLVEAKARFDEGDNIEWAKQLEKVGCRILYGMKDLKVHGKALLISRKENNEIKRYVQLGTGNYYKAPYVDMSLFTANEDIGKDIEDLFSNLVSPQERNEWRAIKSGPIDVEKEFIHLIQNEIENAKKGKKAKITAKMNGLTDKTMVENLYEASKAGVKITLIVRGPSILMPGIKDLSENIEVFSIVGRFLEHSRVFRFENDGDKKYYLSSADWMTRNLERRIELLFPIFHKKNQEQIDEYFENILKDNMKRWKEESDGTYTLVKKEKDEKDFNYQEHYLENKF